MYRIRAVARITGLTPELIRAWERRYGLVRPERSAGRYRLYTDRAVAILKGARTLVEGGLSIGEVARLDEDRLLAAAAPSTTPGGPPGSSLGEAAVGEVLEALRRFDRDQLDAVVDRFAGALAPVALCRDVLLPLLRAIGDAWHRGEITVAMEHFGSALLRARLVRTLDLFDHPPDGPRAVCACPAGEQHEGALLTFAVHAAAVGWHVIYLGANVPDDDLIDAVQRAHADLLALSLTMEGNADRVRTLVARIRSHARSSPQVIIGGAGALAHRALLEAADIAVADNVTIPLPTVTPRPR